MKIRTLSGWLGLLMLVLVGCGSGGDGTLEVTDVWARTSPAAAANSAFYMNITNNTGADEELLAAATDACGVAELHEMFEGDEGVMVMQPVPGGKIAIPDGETVSLKVGGLHVMCLDKQVEFNAGDEIPLILTFAQAGEMTVTAEVRDSEGGMEMEHDGMQEHSSE